jgi:stage II sporulation protein AA (anti-sigma F factor antagonist)
VEVRTSSLTGVALLEVEGDIDHSSANMFDRAVEESLNNGDHLLIDLTDCPYVDSGGLAVILSTVNRLTAEGWVGVVGSNRNVSRLFEIVGLTRHPAFRTFDDLPAAQQMLVGTAS